MGRRRDLRNEIVALANLPDAKIGLAEAALTIARSEYPDLNEAVHIEQLNEMAALLRRRIGTRDAEDKQISEMNRLLFEEEGFCGNTADYYDPRNSFLNEVLERKLGIPITLSIIYIEVGRRAGMPLYGIGFPGHFLTGLLAGKGRLVIDPFNNGRVLSESDCRTMVRGRFGMSRAFSPSFLDPVWPKQILVRLLRNLKAVYQHGNDAMKALRMIEWILILDPASALELKERGLFYTAIGDTHGAIRDLQRFLELAPEDEDKERIRATIEDLKRSKSMVH